MVHRKAGVINANSYFRVHHLKSITYPDPAKTVIQSMFGRVLSDTEMAGLVGAIDASEVRVEARGNSLFTSTKHPKIVRQHRFVQRSSTGMVFVRNDDFYKKDPQKHDSLGLRSFVTQVVTARKLGIPVISAFIAGNNRSIKRINGYFVWALYGFQAPLSVKEILSLPPKLKGARTLNQLILRGGRSWWEEYGNEREAEFDLSDGSSSLRVLQEYLKSKGFNVQF